MTARGSRGSSLAVSVLVTLLAVAGAVSWSSGCPAAPVRWPTGRRASASAPPPAAASARAPAGPSTSPSASLAHPASPRGTATGPQQAAPPGHRPRRRRRPASPRRPASTPPAGQSAAAQQVLALINQARAQAGLAAYTVSSGLDTSAARHTSVMAGGLRPVAPVPGRAGPGGPGDRGRGALDRGRGEHR